MPKPAARNEEALYEIRVGGLLDESWSDWLDGLAITPSDDGDSVLTGPIRDQCALHGLLVKIRDLGLTLLSVEQKDPTGGQDECWHSRTAAVGPRGHDRHRCHSSCAGGLPGDQQEKKT